MKTNETDKTKSDAEIVFNYHQQTKHHLTGYAKGPDTIDWSAQPLAFRHYENARTLDLLFSLEALTVSYDDLFTNSIASQPLSLSTLSGFFELSLGLSAWKQYGPDRWALRANPSSGNLHPTEAYALLKNIEDVPDGVYHYCSDQHQLEQRCQIYENKTSPKTNAIGTTNFLLCLSSVHWREAWKYGERAFRYSQLDIGHALATLRTAAACYGWQIKLLLDISHSEADKLFGFDRRDDYVNNEPEYSDVVIQVNTQAGIVTTDNTTLGKDDLNAITTSHWNGKANTLDDKHHYDWPSIDGVEQATLNPGTNIEGTPASEKNLPVPLTTSLEKATILIKQRRSAQLFDSRPNMPEPVFWKMLDKLLVRPNIPPFDSLPWQARIHPVMFIHRVENFDRGLYVLPRHANAVELLKSEMRPDFSWEKVTNEQYQHIELYKLVQANCENAARTLFCHQDIASDSAFAIGMLAEFKQHVNHKPWQYRQLHWEAGVLGQALYLEAEASHFRATGVGCFFDDYFHETLGLKTQALQSVYHFTVGTPLIDNRIVSLSGYHHIKRRK